jgi:NAD(P)-dependent dehydrogenase (short-subunit alcohol dehydrogenase family)
LEGAGKEDKIMGDRVKGKVAIVTGAGSSGPGIGNGKASAILYAREGARVLAVDYNLEAAEETKRLIDDEGGECIVFKADVTKSSDCKSMVDKCIHTFGRVDILHNNVGIVEPGGPVEISEETWDRVINVNLKSMFLSCKYALPYMEKQGSGCIVNISSISAVRVVHYPAVAYTASKAGVIALTRDIAIQYVAKGIRANAILPGYMNTPLVVASLTQTCGGDVDKLIKKRDAMCPTGKQGDAWDVAYAALFLASDEAKYITGTTLIVDGGITCTHKMF